MLFWASKYVILGAPGTCKIKLRLERERHFHIFTQSRKSHEKVPKIDPQIPATFPKNLTSLLAPRPSLPQTPSIYRLRYLTATSITRLGAFRHPPKNLQKSRSGTPGVFHGAPWAPQLGKMVLQGAKSRLKVPSRHRKPPFLAEEGNQKKASIPSCFMASIPFF